MALSDAISHPVEAHANRLGLELFNGVINYDFSVAVVSLDWSGWLWLSHLLNGGADDTTILGIVEEGTKLGFGDGENYVVHDVGKTWIVSLSGGAGSRDLAWDLRKCKPLEQEKELVSERYDASQWMCQNMPLLC